MTLIFEFSDKRDTMTSMGSEEQTQEELQEGSSKKRKQYGSPMHIKRGLWSFYRLVERMEENFTLLVFEDSGGIDYV